MKAQVYDPKEEKQAYLSLKEVELPKVNANETLIKVRGVGVCGSDLLKLNNSLITPGVILGHEMVGEIVQIPGNLSKKYRLKIGDRIVSSHHVPCHSCKFCLNKKESLCSHFKNTNFKPGAFCEYLVLTEGHLEHTVLKIPDSVSDLTASFTEPLACCLKAVKSTRIASFKGSVKVLVIGLGSIGLLLGQSVLRTNSEIELTGLDLLENKRELALKLGFHSALDKLSSDYQADFIFLSAGTSLTVDLAVKHAELGATIVVFSSVEQSSSINFNNNDIYYKELRIIGSYSPNIEDLEQSLKLLSEKKVLVDKLITHTASIEDLGLTIKKMCEEKGIKTFLKLY